MKTNSIEPKEIIQRIVKLVAEEENQMLTLADYYYLLHDISNELLRMAKSIENKINES